MSNIYIQEPPSNGKDEFHSRLRFVRRGLVAMANAGPSDNGSQFFFTLGSTPELAQKHTIFGKVTGNTIYNMLKLQEVGIGPNDRPYCPPKITSTEVLSNPFDDIVPRQLKRPKKEKTEEKKNKSQSKATKNFNLLSFGEEAEEDEVEVNKATKDMRGKSKSSHDLTDDPKLSATPAIDHEEETQENEDAAKSNVCTFLYVCTDGYIYIVTHTITYSQTHTQPHIYFVSYTHTYNYIHAYSHTHTQPHHHHHHHHHRLTSTFHASMGWTDDEGPEEERTQQRPLKALKDSNVVDSKKGTPEKKLTRSEELHLESEKLKKEIREMKYPKVVNAKEEKEHTDPGTKSEVVAEFRKEREKYKELKYQQGKNGPNREEITLDLLSKFQNRLRAAQKVGGDYSDDDEAESKDDQNKGDTIPDDDTDDINDMSWLRHKLHFIEPDLKVLDANVHDVDRYELFDPRNPITKRRREASKQAMSSKK
ncbi:spliceosome-associated protein CWC27 homolog [Octopus bimaculoides]|uniref:spliceosome-associated protein CWC27 homolog n=1 Tax=Octopus bimaculoides TaxID=37653 RepID=UPI0022E18C64|nr:spliceosome-associated protein CWC27 homolog [Octopus bimaculoides]